MSLLTASIEGTNQKGTEKDIKDILSKDIKSSCNKCYGRGYIGFKQKKDNIFKSFVPCYKCHKPNTDTLDLRL